MENNINSNININIGGSTLTLKKGDITAETTEAIANAANSGLRGGGGVDGAIHRAGGPIIMEELKKYKGCPTGSAVITTGGDLKAKYVIHAVGPIYKNGKSGEDKLLSGAYRKCLEIATDKGIKSIAFPSISTGVYGYPIAEASKTALSTVIDYLKEHPEIETVRFVLFSDKDLKVYKESLRGLLD